MWALLPARAIERAHQPFPEGTIAAVDSGIRMFSAVGLSWGPLRANVGVAVDFWRRARLALSESHGLCRIKIITWVGVGQP